MKDQSRAAIQFSGYPLTIAEPNKKSKENPGLAVVKTANDQTTSVQKSTITNDPKNWDLNWFNNYE
jgi:hypothetical protein